jgi:mRNA-degrading endonuclease YafQ of YafQ-DinJ toxin-antitoxin module
MTTELAACKTLALNIATDFRRCEPIRAEQSLTQLIETLLQHFPMQDINHIRTLKSLAMGIRQCQDKKDWLGIADYLQYELQDLLQHYSQ